MNTRQKGQLLEKYVCEQVKDKGLDITPRPSFNSGATNTEKADIWTSMMILGQNAGIECKNQSILKIPEWWKQTKKLESLSKEPVLCFKIYGEPLQESKVVIYLDTFLEIVKESNEYRKIKKDEKKEFKIGDTVNTYLLRSTGAKVKVKGIIKSIKKHYGSNTYTLTKCVVEDFPARNIK